MILFIDNYDSFVHNLARYVRNLDESTVVVRNDAIDINGVRRLNPRAIILSPGPGVPERSGCCLELITHLHRQIPILGVCLGHQAIAVALGGEVRRAKRPIHGTAFPVSHDGHPVFDRVPSPFDAGRYHSLEVNGDRLPASMTPISWSTDNQLMGISHDLFPVVGLQFHPESILTGFGYQILYNFLKWSGCSMGNAELTAKEMV